MSGAPSQIRIPARQVQLDLELGRHGCGPFILGEVADHQQLARLAVGKAIRAKVPLATGLLLRPDSRGRDLSQISD